MTDLNIKNEKIKKTLKNSKIIAMIGVSSVKDNEDPKALIRRPSLIVMKYLQDFGYKVIPVNPKSAGKKIQGEITVSKIEDIKAPIDIVNVFRPSKEAPGFAKEAVKLNAKALWLQYGIESLEAQAIVESANIVYIANRCIKQEYQKMFLKVNPVFPVLKN